MNTIYPRIRTGLQILMALAVIAALFVMPAQAALAGTIPTFAITAVDPDNTVTIKTANFPAARTFTARIGEYGTLGIAGTVVGTTDSGTGGTFTVSYSIPAALKGKGLLAIRLESPAGYFAYNWFVNKASPTIPVTGYTGIPTFAITSVDKGVSVTVKTNNFPASKDFTVRIGKFGTLGVGGTVVKTTNSGAGGAMTVTYDIPTALKDEATLAIRMDSTTGGFFAYNFFANKTTSITPTPVPGYTGFPTFVVTAVVKDATVTVKASNLPAGKDFTVRMGTYGTLGVGGTVVATTNSGAGGTLTVTYDIPAALKGSTRIAIRMDATTGGFFAFNWFWNQ